MGGGARVSLRTPEGSPTGTRHFFPPSAQRGIYLGDTDSLPTSLPWAVHIACIFCLPCSVAPFHPWHLSAHGLVCLCLPAVVWLSSRLISFLISLTLSTAPSSCYYPGTCLLNAAQPSLPVSAFTVILSRFHGYLPACSPSPPSPALDK